MGRRNFCTQNEFLRNKDLADKTSKKQKIIGLRQGEKIKEILITKDEKNMAIEKKNMWIIRPYANS